MPLVGQDGGAGGFAGGRAEKVFRELHLVAVRPVRAVELHHRELGVVTDGDAFVAEVAVDFEDALEAAHDEALQIEFRRDAQVHVHVERIVVRDERLGVGAARNRVEHRRLDLEEAVREHEAADRGDGLGADEEAVAGVLVHDEVDVALAVAHFGVDETLVLVGQRTDVLRHEAKLMGTDGEFAGLRAEERALDGDDVAEVERLPGGIGFFADVALRDEVLHVAREVADGREARLAHDALGHHAASQRDDLSGLSLGRKVSKLIFEVGRVRILRIFGDFKGVMTGFAQVCQLLAAHSGLLGQLLLGLGLILLHVRSSFRDF